MHILLAYHKVVRSACVLLLSSCDLGFWKCEPFTLPPESLLMIFSAMRMVMDTCLATVGAVSNPDNMNQVLSKAGRKRHLGKRPSVRGVVMNPVDHPHGGGEGKSSGGRHPVTPWGKKTRGPKTRKNKATDRLIIRRRNAKR